MDSASGAASWLIPGGSGQGRGDARSWQIAFLLFGLVYAFFLLLLMLKGCPIHKPVEFDVEPTDSELGHRFCAQLSMLQWLMPHEQLSVSGDGECSGLPTPRGRDIVHIRVRRLTCGWYGSASDYANGIRSIYFCPELLDRTSLPHEYVHQKRGHVCIDRNLLFNVFADFLVTVELVFRVVLRTPQVILLVAAAIVAVLFSHWCVKWIWKLVRIAH